MSSAEIAAYGRAAELALDGTGPERFTPVHSIGSVLILGGSGFLGQWLLAASLAAFPSATITATFNRSRPSSSPAVGRVQWRQAGHGEFAALIDEVKPEICFHFAASSSAKENAANPVAMLSLAATMPGIAGACARCGCALLFASSGAVYGDRRLSDGGCKESDRLGLFQEGDPRLDYAVSKIYAERVLSGLAAPLGLNYASLRLFSFAGRGLPLDAHFAAGIFARETAAGRHARPQNGTPIRSWMHPADAAAWSIRLALRGERIGAINVGSPDPWSIQKTANFMNIEAGLGLVEKTGVDDPSAPAYWPSIEKAELLGLRCSMNPEAALRDLMASAAIS